MSGVCGRNPAETPPETPPANARAGREPLNPGTRNPPDPPGGGSTQRWVIIEEEFVSDRGRRRRRSVRVDLDEVRRGLDVPSAEDLSVWRQIRSELQRRVGESTVRYLARPDRADRRRQRATTRARGSRQQPRGGRASASAGCLQPPRPNLAARSASPARPSATHSMRTRPGTSSSPINPKEAAG